MKGALMYQDVREKIVTQLQTNLATMLGTIDTERSTSTPVPLSYDPPSNEGNYPTLFVELGETAIEENQASIEVMRDVTELRIMVMLKHGDTYILRQWGENYIEAILRIMQNYVYEQNDGNFATIATKVIREDLDQEQEQTIRGAAVIMNVYRNQLQ